MWSECCEPEVATAPLGGEKAWPRGLSSGERGESGIPDALAWSELDRARLEGGAGCEGERARLRLVGRGSVDALESGCGNRAEVGERIVGRWPCWSDQTKACQY